MAGLNDFISDSQSKTTTLPSWYDTAQQQVVQQATQGTAQVPQLQNTVAGGAIQNLSGANNPFFAAQNVLGQIGTGAANPWLTDASGNVTPDTSTALGGLFQAQNQQLNQLMPTVTAPAQAAAIGSGNFGSLRGQTAVDTAKANALADLQTKQMQAALQNQQTGVAAGQQLGNVGAQGTSAMTTLGQAQQAAPLTAVSDLAQILSAVKAPASVTQTAQLSPLSQIGSLLNASNAGYAGLNSLVGSLFPYQKDAAGNILKDAAGKPIAATLGSLAGGLGDVVNKLWGGSTTSTTPLSDQQVSDMISGGGASSMSLDQLQSLYNSGNINQDQYIQLVQNLYPVTDYPTDSSGNLQFDQ